MGKLLTSALTDDVGFYLSRNIPDASISSASRRPNFLRSADNHPERCRSALHGPSLAAIVVFHHR